MTHPILREIEWIQLKQEARGVRFLVTSKPMRYFKIKTNDTNRAKLAAQTYLEIWEPYSDSCWQDVKFALLNIDAGYYGP
mmetsp:Transcript_14210/g.21639  ORF Transcript_14210/g.21639 Transcript_14210/m.21639 type:complete len:80 (+) Transcript_14210:1450-1689(+)